MTDTHSDQSQPTTVQVPTIGAQDGAVLRRLAGDITELANRDSELKKAALWTQHNDLQPVRPLVFCDPEHGWGEIITSDQLECTEQHARQIEYQMRKELFWGTCMGDDRVVTPYLPVQHLHTVTDYGVETVYTRTEDQGSHVWDAPIKDYEQDMPGLRVPKFTVDHQATEHYVDMLTDLFGDLWPVRLRGGWQWSFGLTNRFIALRGLENMLLDMYEQPEHMHRLMAFLRDAYMEMLDDLESQDALSLNNEADYVGSGAFGWTTQLPADDFAGHVRTKDVWMLSESQETVGVSPAMFEEFVFQYQFPIMQRFGLVCYGCCEPVHDRWHIISKASNLRRVSISPWCDRAKMAGYMGDRYVYSVKPNPTLLASPTFSEDAVRDDVRDVLQKARGCRIEFVMKDNHTIGNDPTRVTRWVRIVKEEIDTYASTI